MKKSLSVVIIIVAIIGLVAGILVGSYNKMVSNRETVDTAYSNLDVSLQRRADLIPKLLKNIY